jgi:hypothetical protein
MKKKLMKKSMLVLGTLGAIAFTVSGLVNTVTFNSKSFMNMSETKFVKRLDEINEKVVKGTGVWNKLKSASVPAQPMQERRVLKSAHNKVQPLQVVKKPAHNPTPRPLVPAATTASSTPEADKAEAIIKQRYDLKMSEFYNGKMFKQPLTTAQFEGSLFMSDGIIESLEVSLPQGKEISIDYSEMHGNIFSYELDGKELSGMIYESGQGIFMVTLTNGPYEGSRMKFIGESQQIDPNRNIAQQPKPLNDDDYDVDNRDQEYEDRYERDDRDNRDFEDEQVDPDKYQEIVQGVNEQLLDDNMVDPEELEEARVQSTEELSEREYGYDFDQ